MQEITGSISSFYLTFLFFHDKEGLKKGIFESGCFLYPNVVGELVDNIENRLGKVFFANIKTFILEYPYIEKEWREIYSLHYCKTNYKSTTPFAIRLHLIKKSIGKLDDLVVDNETKHSEDYLGYITLRPLPTSFISKIVIKPDRKFYNIEENKKLFMITSNQKVHIGPKEINFQAFPFFSQDGAVTVCAHADAWMVTNIMHEIYGTNEISLENLISGIPLVLSGRKIPSNGISMSQLAVSLAGNGQYVQLKYFLNKEGNEEENFEELMLHIDSCIESCIPCILAFNNHVIVIAGHTIDDKGENREYIIFDDSGYHIKKSFGEQEIKYSIKLPSEKLHEVLKKVDYFYLLYPEFERVYFPLTSVYRLIKKYTPIKKMQKDTDSNLKYRIILVDSRELKKFLDKNEIHVFDEYAFPHYIWLVERYKDVRGDPKNLIDYILFDASANPYDYRYSVIRYKKGSEEVFILKAKEGEGKEKILSLLKEF